MKNHRLHFVQSCCTKRSLSQTSALFGESREPEKTKRNLLIALTKGNASLSFSERLRKKNLINKHGIFTLL